MNPFLSKDNNVYGREHFSPTWFERLQQYQTFVCCNPRINNPLFKWNSQLLQTNRLCVPQAKRGLLQFVSDKSTSFEIANQCCCANMYSHLQLNQYLTEARKAKSPMQAKILYKRPKLWRKLDFLFWGSLQKSIRCIWI